MISRTYIPRPPLSDFVEIFWYYDGYHVPHPKERVLPNGSMQLIINLAEDRLSVFDRQNTDESRSFGGCLISGAHSEFVVIDTACQNSIMGAAFKRGGGFPFFRMPAGELHNAQVSLDVAWGAKARELRERLLEAQTPEARFQILERALFERAARFTRHPAVAFALSEFGQVPQARTIADVSGQIGLSARRFIQVFNDEVGLTPKLFCRVRRFQEVLRVIGREQAIDWATVASDCGYFDQAHFIHDFRAFSGLNPTSYVANRGEFQNHVPLID
jgi:AraC-like DNA-binding protein